MRVDARGYSCPEPMLMATDAIRDAGDSAGVVVDVSDGAARDSVLRVAQKLGRPSSFKETEDGFEITIGPTGGNRTL
ncbi:MAG: sulfurtransferase TusA family protein [Planctomycetota bacterium]|nr:sulfurtransferase TusA family protein [Planctomycetota bacterium]